MLQLPQIGGSKHCLVDISIPPKSFSFVFSQKIAVLLPPVKALLMMMFSSFGKFRAFQESTQTQKSFYTTIELRKASPIPPFQRLRVHRKCLEVHNDRMANSGRRFCYTLDVLTDGSEHTGCGTLFLSVWKTPLAIYNTTHVDDSSDSEDSSSSSDEESVEEDDNYGKDGKQNNADETETISGPYSWLTGADDEQSNNVTREIPVPVARYALSGLGDATTRLCADQRFKLAMTKACFLPTLKQADGLSALFLALYGAGSQSLHLVVPKNSIDMEDLATLVLGTYKNMDIRTCEVAFDPSNTLSWWRVYEDDHLIVHASSANQFLGKEGDLLYLYSFPSTQLRKKAKKNPYCTLALLPPRCKGMDDIYDRLMQQNLPMIRDNIPMTSIDYVVFLDPHEPVDQTGVPLNSQLLVTMPKSNGQKFDEGILIRSQQLHQRFSQSLPHAFAPPPTASDIADENDKEQVFVLKSGTSIVLEKNGNSQQSIPNQRIWDRRKSIWKKEPKAEWTRETLESLKSLVSREYPLTSQEIAFSDENEIVLEDDESNSEQDEIEDENEIDLDEEDESPVTENGSKCMPLTQINDEKNLENTARNIATHGSGPRLVVLGTGCATPSAYRGSSGYALVLPKDDDDQIYLLDCGEGVSTMLSRNCGDWKRRVRGIWISHSHLDHYGGLPNLLRLLLEERKASNQTRGTNEQAAKRPRHSPAIIPWVVAPRKVLRYLDLVLGCQHGCYKDGTRVYMQPNQHHDPRRDPPFVHFESIKVHHNCCPAFGLLVGWKKTNSNQFLCYSGDTRPCKNLVRACNRAILQSQQQCHYGTNNYSNTNADLFLIHEATFRDAERTMAQTKKHSTLTEALEVATDIPQCSRVLMTHFSQRYDNVEGDSEWRHNTKQGGQNSGDATTALPLVGLAVDGLWINLD